MQLIVSWEGNADGESGPLIIQRPVGVKVQLVDDFCREIAAPHVLTARLHHDRKTHTLEPLATAGFTAEYTVFIPQRWSARGSWLKLEVRDLEGKIVAKRSIVVLARWDTLIARWASVVLALVSIYTLVLFPRLKSAVDWFQGSKELVVIGSLTALGLLRKQVARLLSRPRISALVLLASIAVAVWLRVNSTLVLNASLDPYATTGPLGIEIKPGEAALVWKFSTSEAGNSVLPCRGATAQAQLEKPPCVRFHEPDALEAIVLRHLVSTVELGCAPQAVLNERLEVWRELKRCRPNQPLLLEGLSFPSAFQDYELDRPSRDQKGSRASKQGPATDSVALSFQWPKSGDVKFPLAGEFRTLSFGPDFDVVGARNSGLALSMQGTGIVRNIRSSLRSGTLQTPVPTGTNTAVLVADLKLQDVPLGTFVAHLGDSPTKCWLVTTGEYVSALVLRSETGFYQFRASAPELVKAVPVCWAGEEPPQGGEIVLDSRWSNSMSWRIIFPSSIAPIELRVLDSADHYLGKLSCPGHPEGSLAAGPLFLENPRKEIATLKLGIDAFWETPHDVSFTNERAGRWFWGCWSNAASPPEELAGTPPWRVLHKKRKDGSIVYQAFASLDICHRNRRQEDRPANCSAASDSDSREWYAKYGPARCDPRRSVLCN